MISRLVGVLNSIENFADNWILPSVKGVYEHDMENKYIRKQVGFYLLYLALDNVWLSDWLYPVQGNNNFVVKFKKNHVMMTKVFHRATYKDIVNYFREKTLEDMKVDTRPILKMWILKKDNNVYEDISNFKNYLKLHCIDDRVIDILEFNGINVEDVKKIKIKFIGKEKVFDNLEKVMVGDVYQ